MGTASSYTFQMQKESRMLFVFQQAALKREKHDRGRVLQQALIFGTNVPCTDQNRKFTRKLEPHLKNKWNWPDWFAFSASDTMTAEFYCIYSHLFINSMSSTCYMVHDSVLGLHILQPYQSAADKSISL